VIDSGKVVRVMTYEATGKQVTIAKMRQYLNDDLNREEVEHHDSSGRG